MKKPPTLAEVQIPVLREKNKELEQRNATLARELSLAEKQLARVLVEQRAVTASFEAMHQAISILASALSNKVAAQKAIRQKARDTLAAEGVKPPASLGAPRTPGNVKKRKRRKPPTNTQLRALAGGLPENVEE